MFAAWGRTVYRFRWTVLVASILMLPASVMLMKAGGHYATRAASPRMESWQARNLMEKQLGTLPVSFTVIFQHPHLRVSDSHFRDAVTGALAPLRTDPHVLSIESPYGQDQAGATMTARPRMVSNDRHSDIAVVNLKGKVDDLIDGYSGLVGKIHAGPLKTTLTGDLQQNKDTSATAKQDLSRSLRISLPLMLLLLLFVFGSLVAAGLPLGVGVLAVVSAIAGTLLLAQARDVISQSQEVDIMIGLGLAIDYSLLIVNRFREEMQRQSVQEALATAMATAGRAVVFSGCTVAIGLLGLTFFHFGAIESVGIAGSFAVALAVIYAFTFLASLLAILGPRVNKVRIPFIHPNRVSTEHGFWHGFSRWVMSRPWQVLIPTVVLLLALGLPFLHIRMAWLDYSGLPRDSQQRQGQAILANQFPGGKTNEIPVIVRFAHGSPLSPRHIAQMYTFSHWLARLPHVTHVEGLVSVPGGLSRAAYQQLYAGPRSSLPLAARVTLRQYVGPNIAVIPVYTPARYSSDEARSIVNTIRGSTRPPIDGRVLVTGNTAGDIDGIKELQAELPLAIGFVMLATYLVLFLLLGSVLLPLKAVVMNLFSITASFGALVWIFQDGHLSGWLGFTANPIDIALPIVMFCILFGLSMDYEVMLLSRFKENWERTGDNTEAVAMGLERSGRIVTGAALIMATVFFAYGASDYEWIKAFGIGMGIAIVVDAAIVRTLLVPATMRLLGHWNWWAPAPLARLHARLGLAETQGEPAPMGPTTAAIGSAE